MLGSGESKGKNRVGLVSEQRIRKCFFVMTVLLAGFLPACGTPVDDEDGGPAAPGPSLETAEYKITTPTRRVYTNDVEDVDDVVTLHGFYAYTRDGWVWREVDLKFDRKSEGEVEVVRKGDPGYPEEYVLPDSGLENLTTVAWWEGDAPREITFQPAEAPWVINAGCTGTSRADSAFRFTVSMASGLPETSMSTESGVHYMVIDQAGAFTIIVEPTACRWWLQVGVE